jgi:8-oxo-dGTP pyrophosphatase MutT (NUDIX family)
MPALTVRPDRYGGVTCVVGAAAAGDVPAFAAEVDGLLAQWAAAGVRGVWVRVPLAEAAVVSALAARSFALHHAGAGGLDSGGYIQMTRWLPTGEPSGLPAYAHHYVGVGGLVINDHGELLTIVEKYAATDGPQTRHLKLPGGLVDRGERLEDAVVREVREETGVDVALRQLVLARHTTTYLWGCSDIYAIGLCRPTERGRPQLRPCAREIASAQWMPVSDFLRHGDVHPLNKAIVAQALVGAARGAPPLRVGHETAAFGARTFGYDVIRAHVEEAPPLVLGTTSADGSAVAAAGAAATAPSATAATAGAAATASTTAQRLLGQPEIVALLAAAPDDAAATVVRWMGLGDGGRSAPAVTAS